MDRKTGTLVATVLGSGLVFLDSTVVNVALPQIGQDLPSTSIGVLEGQSYVYNAYLLSLSALLIIGGALADAYGRRRLFLIGLAAFGVTSLLCGIAPTVEALILFRLAQGAAAALLVPGSLAILMAAFEGPRLGRALGIWAGASGAATILGPLFGGLLVQAVSWRAAFLVNVPIVLAALWVTRASVDESRDPSAARSFDWGGAALVALAIGGVTFGAIHGGQHGWQDAVGPVALGIGGVASVAFFVHMTRGRDPLVPPALFRVRNFAATNLATFLVYGALYVFLYLVAIFTQGSLGYSAAAAGVLSVPSAALLTFLSPWMGDMASRLGPRRFMAAGPLVMAAGLLWLVRLPSDSPAWVLDLRSPATWVPPTGVLVDFLPALVLFGLGLAILVAPLTTALMTSLPAPKAGLGSAVNNAISRVAPQLVGALTFVLVTAVFYASLASLVPGLDPASPEVRASVAPFNPPSEGVGSVVGAAAREASTTAFHFAMGVGAVLLGLGALVSAAWIEDRRPVSAP